MRVNPFYKYLKYEDKLESSIIKHVNSKYPDIVIFHIPNEGKRTPFERYKFKVLGSISGVPDLFIAKANKQYNGLFLECKSSKGTLSKNQKSMKKRLENSNYKVEVVKTLYDTINVLADYLKNENG